MTAALRLYDGTVAAPGLVFASSTNTGFYKTTFGWGFSVGGVQVAEFTAGGLSKGVRYIGELIPYTGSSAPPLCVFPQGQVLSRTAYPDLWTFAQTQIGLGNVFYNNGNGSSTFGIGDLRGRVVVGQDPGNSTGRLNNNTGAGGVNGAVMGGTGGEQSHQLTVAELPVFTPSGSVSSSSTSSVSSGIYGGTNQTTGLLNGGGNTFPLGNGVVTVSTSTTSTFFGNQLGGNSFHNVVQPTIVTQYALFAGA